MQKHQKTPRFVKTNLEVAKMAPQTPKTQDGR
jgi:hypothetical protein